MKNNNRNIIFYDAECVFCNFWVKWLMKRDKKHTFYFASLRSQTAKELGVNQQNKDTLVLIYKDTVFIKSRAVAAILSELSFPYRIISTLMMLLPVCWTDKVYSFVAANRYFSGRKLCNLKEQEQFKSYILS